MSSSYSVFASHELRTLITTFKGLLQLLLKHLATPTPDAETLRDYAARALRQSQRLEGLVNDLVEVSRLQQGKDTLHPERVTLQRLVAQAVEVAQVTTIMMNMEK